MAQQNNPFYVEPTASGALVGLGDALTRGVLQERKAAQDLERKALQDSIIAEGDALLAGG